MRFDAELPLLAMAHQGADKIAWFFLIPLYTTIYARFRICVRGAFQTPRNPQNIL
ncbi:MULTISPECIES: hypothetical protein [Paraburkholderia]|uniref:hypothetical protein n=1 Tax=Paraburkholderia TaxID=1822464 RepID=UPI00224CD7FA|nr:MULTISPECIES: hypothetical protein [Paraburkholderia]MCX4161207.1 hypothetical protein [Paraburkholderia megapolitana]MDN7156703.1 hypothetical protein [Paraburkholderia sp. CHISQ3]MDQ6493748.1 hypothetical protein [Paraburkholderia megapolitana]